MEYSNESILSILLSRRLHPTSAGAAFDSRQIFRDYVVRQINLLQWFSLIAITTLLLNQLVRLFDQRRRGNRIPVPPFQLFVGKNPQEYLSGKSKTSTGQQS